MLVIICLLIVFVLILLILYGALFKERRMADRINIFAVGIILLLVMCFLMEKFQLYELENIYKLLS